MSTTTRTYRQQITLAARSMAAAGHADDFRLSECSLWSDSIRPIAQKDVAGRLLKLQSACELLADGFDQLDEQIDAYVALVPLSPFDSDREDADRFLDWLELRVDLDDERRDFVAALRARNAVELVAVKKRLAHVRFQEQSSMNERLLGELDSDRDLRVYLNPIHVWSQFETHALLDDDDDLPATVLFYPVGSDVRTVVVDAGAKKLLEDLNQSGPTSVASLLRRTPRRRRGDLFNLLRDFAQLSVIALG